MGEVLQSACLSVCPLAHRNNHIQIYEIFCACHLSLGPPDGIAIHYVLLFCGCCFDIMVHIQWLGSSGHQRATHHPLSEQYRLACSLQQTI